MKFYTQTHDFYCGIDLHARSTYLCILRMRVRRRRSVGLSKFTFSVTNFQAYEPTARHLRPHSFPRSVVQG